MKVKKKDEIVNAAIDLFSEKGVRSVSMEMIAEQAGISRSVIYHHFPKGKDEITDGILKLFDKVISDNMPAAMKSNAAIDVAIDAEYILTNLYLSFKKEDSECGRKIGRIIFADHAYDKQIGRYLSEVIYEKRKARFTQVFDLLVAKGKIEPFDTNAAARIFNRMFIAYALEDTFYYPFEDNELSPILDDLRNDCMIIVKQMLIGCFSP
jgi:AcrR family transcriptional regulator